MDCETYMAGAENSLAVLEMRQNKPRQCFARKLYQNALVGGAKSDVMGEPTAFPQTS